MPYHNYYYYNDGGWDNDWRWWILPDTAQKTPALH
jgi:hypothetical protein